MNAVRTSDQESRRADVTTVWKTYVLGEREICRMAGIPLPDGQMPEFEMTENGVRVTVKYLEKP